MASLANLLIALEALIGRSLSALVRLVATIGRAVLARGHATAAHVRALPRRIRFRAVGAVAATLLGIGAWDLRDGPVNTFEAAADVRPLLRAKSWHYHLQNLDVEDMRRNPADLIVMDHARDGGREALKPAEVERIRLRADGTRRTAVISYVSIGEAEDYRWYWEPAWSDPAKAASKPAWLGEANCAWPDNYAIQFWHEGWKKLMYGGPDSFIGRIIKAGFDGVYLDRVDIYEQYEKERPTAKEDMVQFVTELAASARSMKPGFMIIAQNGEDLLHNRRYRRVIDGLGKEDLLHGHNGTGVPNPRQDIDWSYDRIKLLLADNKPVFAVEYLVTREAIADARSALRERGIVPTFAHRSLDGSDPTMPRFEKEASVGTPEFIKQRCADKKAW